MGYKREEKHYRLKFEDEEFEGLEVTARSLAVGDFLDIMGIDQSNPDPAEVSKLFEALGKGLVSWNLEDEDGPVPATLEGVRSQEFGFVMAIIAAWLSAIADVDPKLRKTSSTSEITEYLPMETL